MERELFDWKLWTPLDQAALDFERITLKKEIGRFPPGTQFDYAVIDLDDGTLELGYEQGEYFRFKLSFNVAGEIISV